MIEFASEKIADVAVKEIAKNEIGGFTEIKSEMSLGKELCDNFWNKLFNSELTSDKIENVVEKIGNEIQQEKLEKEIKELLKDYIKDLKSKSICPETISDKAIEASELKKITPEENAEMREEFSKKKNILKKEWEEKYERPWPTYEHDIYSANGKLIRKAGSDYDAHHIKPLCMGGKNEIDNITPLNAEVHYDKQGVHAPDSPYSKLNEKLGELN